MGCASDHGATHLSGFVVRLPCRALCVGEHPWPCAVIVSAPRAKAPPITLVLIRCFTWNKAEHVRPGSWFHVKHSTINPGMPPGKAGRSQLRVFHMKQHLVARIDGGGSLRRMAGSARMTAADRKEIPMLRRSAKTQDPAPPSGPRVFAVANQKVVLGRRRRPSIWAHALPSWGVGF